LGFRSNTEGWAKYRFSICVIEHSLEFTICYTASYFLLLVGRYTGLFRLYIDLSTTIDWDVEGCPLNAGLKI
jgi:hypothetical protein